MQGHKMWNRPQAASIHLMNVFPQHDKYIDINGISETGNKVAEDISNIY